MISGRPSHRPLREARRAQPRLARSARRQLRTLTNLYNERPAWLRGIHARLDAAVLAAHGWPADIDDDLHERLLARNRERAERRPPIA